MNMKSQNHPNSINLGSNGVVPVAIFGSQTFDVAQIDNTTITLANAGIKLKGNGQPVANYENINGDGFIDIIVYIFTDALQLTETDEKAELNSFLFNGRNIKREDLARIVL